MNGVRSSSRLTLHRTALVRYFFKSKTTDTNTSFAALRELCRRQSATILRSKKKRLALFSASSANVVGREVTLYTDHKPLTYIFHPEAGISPTALQRIQRWALFLAGFTFQIKHRPGKDNYQADALSRTTQQEYTSEEEDVTTVQVSQITAGPTGVVGVEQVRTATRRDRELARVLDCVLKGWPSICPTEKLRPYWVHRDELTSEDGVLLWGLRVVVPQSLRHDVLELLHESHPGSTRCRQLARSYVWWAGIDRDVENKVNSCSSCIEERREPNAPAMGRWEFAERPWKRLHIDHAGPFLGRYWFLWIDANTKFAGVHRVSSTDTARVIQKLREVFAYFGLPDQIVSDNGPAFVAEEFQQFL